MDKNGDGILTTSEVESLTLEDLQAISNEVRKQFLNISMRNV